MALQFVDGFDIEASADLPVKWNQGAVATGGNAGSNVTSNAVTPYGVGQAYQAQWINFNTGSGSYLKRYLGGNFGTLTVGFAFNPGPKPNDGGATGCAFFAFYDTNNQQVFLHYNASNFLEVMRASTVLCTGTTPLNPNAWYYIEMQVVFATGATGSVTVRLNNVVECSATSVQTAVGTLNSANSVALGIVSNKNSIVAGQYYFDDFYCCDSSGSVNNTFLGAVSVTGLLPSGAGTNTHMTIGGTTPAATNWQSVNQAAQDADVTYVSSQVVGTYDTYAYQDLATNVSQIFAVVSTPVVRRDAAGLRSIATRCRNNGGEANGPQTASLQPSYFWPQMMMDFNPVTGIAWTVLDVNNGEFGIYVSV